MLENILDQLYDIYYKEENFNVEHLIQYIDNYQPQLIFENSIEPVYDYCSFLSFLSTKEFYRKQEEIYTEMNSSLTDEEIKILKSALLNYIQKFTQCNQPNSISDSQTTIRDILKFDKNIILNFLNGFLNELEKDKEIKEIKICGCHNLIFYIRKYIKVLNETDTNGALGSNYFLEVTNFLQIILTYGAAKFNTLIKLKKHLYHTVANKIFYESVSTNTLVFYGIATILQRIYELYTCVRKYMENEILTI